MWSGIGVVALQPEYPTQLQITDRERASAFSQPAMMRSLR
jgi:hypothetical protein